MSNLLAIDITTKTCSVALSARDVITSESILGNRQQTQFVLTIITELLSAANVSLQELDAIAFANGPDGFTGIRIAAGITQGLALAANLPVIAISSLQVLAQTAYEKLGVKKAIVALDAHMHEIYWAAYQLDDSNLMQNVIPDQLYKPANLPSVLGSNWTGLGDGWKTYAEILTAHYKQQLEQIDTDLTPRADALLTLAKVEFLAKNFVKADKAQPIYLRDKTAWKKVTEQKKE